MPYTGALTVRQHGKDKMYAAALAGDPPEWVKVPHGYSDGTHVDFKPQLGVRVAVLKNHNTPPRKMLERTGGRIPAESWRTVYWVPRGSGGIEGVEVDWAVAGPKPEGKGWGKGLEEVY